MDIYIKTARSVTSNFPIMHAYIGEYTVSIAGSFSNYILAPKIPARRRE